MSDKKPLEENSQKKELKQEFGIQRIYIKDCSFEAPNTPKVFLEEYAPEVKLDLKLTHDMLDEKHADVCVHITVTARQKDKTVFLVEVQQAGIFVLEDFDQANIPPVLGIVCPNILFPYAREACSDLVVKGGFPPLYLSPVNFEALYADKAASKDSKAANDS